MQLSLRLVVVLIIAVLVIVALFGAASGLMSDIGDAVTGTGDNQTDTLECVLGNPENDADDCSPVKAERKEPEVINI